MRSLLAGLLFAILLAEPQEDKRFRDKIAEIAAFLKTAKTPMELRAAVGDLQEVAQEAAAQDCYDAALKALEQADKVARGLKDAELLATIQLRLSEEKALQQEWTKVRSSLKVLEEKPEDPEANLAVGKYYCAWKGDWDRGLSLLRKSADAALKGLAESEFIGSGASEAKVELGDRWWTYAEKQPRFRDRALYWYRSAWSEVKGIAREKIRTKAKQAASKGKGQKLPVPAPWIFGSNFKDSLWLDDTYAHSGKLSLVMSKRPEGAPGALGVLTPQYPATPGLRVSVSAWTFSEGPGAKLDLYVRFFDADGKFLGQTGPHPPDDMPFWIQIKEEVTCPDKTAKIDVSLANNATAGMTWIDDLSLKGPTGAELVQNASFEEKR